MTEKMNAAVKQYWVTALRSGEFPQATKYLRTGDGYCCLGVLCELAVRDEIIVPPTQHEGVAVTYYRYADAATTLPDEVLNWGALYEWNPKVPAPEGYVDSLGNTHRTEVTLAELNDRGYTFDQIADLIEEYL